MKTNLAGRALLAAIAVIFGMALSFTRPLAAAMPELSFKDRAGNTEPLSAYRGKIIVLNFWATWCIPCRHELPMLNKLAQEYSKENVVFIAVSIDDAKTQPRIQKFLEKKQITLPIWVGASPETLKQLDLGGIIPATLLLDENGKPISRIMGEARRKDIRSRVDWLLDGRKGPQPKAILKNY